VVIAIAVVAAVVGTVAVFVLSASHSSGVIFPGAHGCSSSGGGGWFGVAYCTYFSLFPFEENGRLKVTRRRPGPTGTVMVTVRYCRSRYTVGVRSSRVESGEKEWSGSRGGAVDGSVGFWRLVGGRFDGLWSLKYGRLGYWSVEEEGEGRRER
jgi:hypothetical protein